MTYEQKLNREAMIRRIYKVIQKEKADNRREHYNALREKWEGRL